MKFNLWNQLDIFPRIKIFLPFSNRLLNKFRKQRFLSKRSNCNFFYEKYSWYYYCLTITSNRISVQHWPISDLCEQSRYIVIKLPDISFFFFFTFLIRRRARGYFPPHWSNRNIKEEKIIRFRRRADAIVKEAHSNGSLSLSIFPRFDRVNYAHNLRPPFDFENFSIVKIIRKHRYKNFPF